MESCLLCLELENRSGDSLKVNSIQWQEYNVQNIIEKHFWTMETIQLSSWLCNRCWKELNEFHKFYVRIEDAHFNLKTMMKIEIPNESQLLGPEITLESTLSTELIIEEENIIIKQELEEDSCEDDTPLMAIRKSIRNLIPEEAANEDPLHTSRKRKNTTKFKAKKKECRKVATKMSRKEKPNPTKFEQIEKSLEIKPELNQDDDSESNTDTDSQYKCKKQRKKQKSQEFDKLLAEHYKMYCNICNTQMETFLKLIKHVKNDHNQRGYVTCCNRKFYVKEILVDHVNQHLDPNYLKCKVCNKIFTSKRSLDAHGNIHKERREKTHCCDICGAGFYFNLALENHKSIHLLEEEKNFPCSHCDKKFGNKWFLYNHVKIVHGTTTNCDICGLVLSTVYALNKHKSLRHPVGEQIDYKCHLCPKISKNRQAHLVHIKDTHQRGFDHKCTMCDKAYKRPRSLKEHIAVHHTGVDLYVCPWCPTTGKTKDVMRTHRKKYHRKEWEEEIRKKFSGKLPPGVKLTSTNIVNCHVIPTKSHLPL